MLAHQDTFHSREDTQCREEGPRSPRWDRAGMSTSSAGWSRAPLRQVRPRRLEAVRGEVAWLSRWRNRGESQKMPWRSAEGTISLSLAVNTTRGNEFR